MWQVKISKQSSVKIVFVDFVMFCSFFYFKCIFFIVLFLTHLLFITIFFCQYCPLDGLNYARACLKSI